LNGAASNPIFPPGELESINPVTVPVDKNIAVVPIFDLEEVGDDRVAWSIPKSVLLLTKSQN
jgi:hypothetical protein